ncbi:hypothetical protein PAMP_004889 [Pampus punctatissimus]
MFTGSLPWAHPYKDNPPGKARGGLPEHGGASMGIEWETAGGWRDRQMDKQEDGCGMLQRPAVSPSASWSVLKIGEMAVLLCQGRWEAVMTSASASATAAGNHEAERCSTQRRRSRRRRRRRRRESNTPPPDVFLADFKLSGQCKGQ